MAWEGPCKGGCDTCDRRAARLEVEKDITTEALLLLRIVHGLKGKFGMTKYLWVARGSKNKEVTQWMMDVKGPQGEPLYGAGQQKSEGWWKGLGGVLQARGLLKSLYVKTGYGYNQANHGYSCIKVTQDGEAFLRTHGGDASGSGSSGSGGLAGRLVVALPPEMEAEDAAQLRREAEAALRQAEREAAAARQSEVEKEKDELREKLRVKRKEVADQLGQVRGGDGSVGFSMQCLAPF
jgi:superfamily II DNA helicase RecQ